MGQPHNVCDLGETEVPFEVFQDFLFDLRDKFKYVIGTSCTSMGHAAINNELNMKYCLSKWWPINVFVASYHTLNFSILTYFHCKVIL